MSEWFTAAEMVKIPGLPGTKRGVQKTIDREGWALRCNAAGEPLVRPRSSRGGGLEYHHTLFPRDAQVHLAINGTVSAQDASGQGAAWAFFEQLPDKKKDIARYRADVIDNVHQLVRKAITRNEGHG